MPVIKTLSDKQLFMWSWFLDPKYRDRDYIISDGSVRSGKTLSMSIGFLGWSFMNFRHGKFIIAGQSVGAVRQNIIDNLVHWAESVGYWVDDNRSTNLITFHLGDNWNQFLIIGDPNKSSKDNLAGRSVSGCFLDECTRMDKGFVNMAISRCNVTDTRSSDDATGTKIWMNCNPSIPVHFIKTDWIDQVEAKNGLHVRFRLYDNPSLTPHQIRQYKTFYSGVFYRRNILGEWATSDSLVFNSFDDKKDVISRGEFKRRTHGKNLTYYCGQDFGFEHFNSIVLMADDQDGNTYLINEVTNQHKQMSYHLNTLNQIRMKYGADIPVYCDSANPDKVQYLIDHGVNAKYANKDVMQGVEYLAGKINTDHFYIVREGAVHIIGNLFHMQWNAKTGKPITTSGTDDDFDALDATRYAVFTHYQDYMNQRKQPTDAEQFNAIQGAGLLN